MDSDGNITTYNSTGVAKGEMKSEQIYERMGSPAASVISIFTLVVCVAHESKQICTYDVPGAIF